MKQYLTEKQNGCILRKWSLTGGGRLRELVAMRELTVHEKMFVTEKPETGIFLKLFFFFLGGGGGRNNLKKILYFIQAHSRGRGRGGLSTPRIFGSYKTVCQKINN